MPASTTSAPVEHPVVPYSPPVWLTPQRTAILAMLWPWLSLALANAVAPRSWPHPPALLPVMLGVMLVPEVVGARWIVRASGSGDAFLRAVAVQAAAFGAAAVVMVPLRSFLPLPLALGFVVFALTVGGFFGLWPGILASLAFEELHPPAHDACDRMLPRLAAWIAGPALAVEVPIVLPSKVLEAPAVTLGIMTLLVPLAVAVWARRRQRERRDWLERVARGEVAGWRIEDAPSPPPAGLVPVVRHRRVADPTGRVRLLVRAPAPSAPFRVPHEERPVALVLEEPDPRFPRPV